MGTATTTFTLTVQAAQPSYVGTLLAGLSSNEWSAATIGTLQTPTINDPIDSWGGGYDAAGRPAFIAVNSGGPEGLLAWPGKGHWDSASNCVYMLAGCVGAWQGSQTVVKYDLATDVFSHWQGATYTGPNTIFGTWGAPHNFDGTCFAPTTRKLYRYLEEQNGTGAATWVIGYWDVDARSGGTIANPYGFYWGNRASTEFFPDVGTLGSVIVAGRFATNGIYAVDLTDNTFTPISHPVYRTDTGLIYHGGKVYMSTGGTDLGWYAIRSDLSIQTLANTPVAMPTTSNSDTTTTQFVSLGSYIYAMRGPTIYRFDPGDGTGTGTWTLYGSVPMLTGVRLSSVAKVVAGGQEAAIVFTATANLGPYEARVWKP